ncbi:DUF2407 C-terminal domain-containing protein [Sphaerosporella brunnea]|uniref:DUF2407 C-terminal domain-containing protein n=1 Tax=Sphaerosporella brunnea TaxID=1250544 RepID=A0A5J5EXB8_9PEZI|nr:DUF2407 C-terminal domain-containing protein [Sphaerosporella brunnea]
MSLLPTHNTSLPPPTLTIRFTTTDADLLLPLSDPSTTTNSLRQLIRTSRPSLSQRKLRLIHSGKVLPDGAPFSALFPLAQPGANIWIHCSVGDPLSADELATEASPLLGGGEGVNASYTTPAPSTLPAPQGFDRLLTQGFSETEVAALRAQFTRLNPDLPVEEIRSLEDRWIDESVDGAGAASQDLGNRAGTYEDMFIGTAVGFFWPIMIWLAREEGVFTPRRRYAVFAGICVNLFFGLVRVFG